MQNVFIMKHYFLALSKCQHATGRRSPRGNTLIVSRMHERLAGEASHVSAPRHFRSLVHQFVVLSRLTHANMLCVFPSYDARVNH